MSNQLISILPNSLVDDFFIFGFIGGIVSYMWYLYVERNDPSNHMSFTAGIYGTFLSGCVGGLLAIIFDKAIELSILVGLLNQIIYMSFLKAAKSGKFLTVLKDVLIRYLTAGTKP
jgi:hypothetical protein